MPNPKDPSVLDARELDAQHPPEFIVFYSQRNDGTWHMERVADGSVMASGSLEAMLDLIGTPEFPHARRATWAEDTLRWRLDVLGMGEITIARSQRTGWDVVVRDFLDD